jgi:hypothetical protein
MRPGLGERDKNMHVDNGLIHCAAFLGMTTTDDRFHIDGTCFFLRVDEDRLPFTYLVSAKHVVRDFFANRPGKSLSVRVQGKTGRMPKIFNTSPTDWIDHLDTKVDMAVYEVPWATWNADDDLDIIALTVPDFTQLERDLRQSGFGLGSEVFIPSAYIHVPGETQNLPVVRFGRVSAMPSEPLWVLTPTPPAFLIETRSLGGMSGAPVLFHTEPYRMGPREPARTDPGNSTFRAYPAFLIGMHVGTYPGQFRSDWAGQIIGSDEQFNSGISIVLPVAQIVEAVNQPVLRNTRRASHNIRAGRLR